VRFLSLYAGLGGFDLGLERAGWTCIGQVESDPYCVMLLRRYWPHVPKLGDVRGLTGDIIVRACGRPEWIVAGFPCQPVSDNGRKKVQGDERWLWPDTARLVGELRPDGVLLENVTGLLRRGMGDVLGDLAALGYDAEWDCIPAASFGAPHLRERVFVVAYPAGKGPQGQEPAGRVWGRGLLAQRDWWPAEPAVHRVGHGVARRVDRTRAIGNAVVPQVAEYVGRCVMEACLSRPGNGEEAGA